jgi:MFS family permease
MRDSSESVGSSMGLLRIVAAAGVAAAAWRYARECPRGSGESGSSEPVPSPQDPDPSEIHVQIDESPEARAAATGSAVAHVLARPDSIRQRGLNAATISSAVIAVLAVALVTQLAGTQTESWRPWTVVAVIAAAVLWVVTVVRFVQVVTLGPPRRVEGKGYQALINAYEAYSNSLRQLLRKAARWSVVALAVTALAVGSVVVERIYVRERDRQLVLTPQGMSAVASICGWTAEPADGDRRVNVKVSSDQLSNQVVEVDVLSRPVRPGRPTECAAETPEMRLPRSSILAAGDLDR